MGNRMCQRLLFIICLSVSCHAYASSNSMKAYASYLYAVVLDIDKNDNVFCPKFIKDSHEIYNVAISKLVDDNKKLIAVFNISTRDFDAQLGCLLYAYKILPALRASFYVRNTHAKGYYVYDQRIFDRSKDFQPLSASYAFIGEGYFLNNKDTDRFVASPAKKPGINGNIVKP